jgi:hypothetical protein
MAYYPPSIDPDALDGTDGFNITGATTDDRLGTSVESAGDVNGDGFDDIIVSGRDRLGGAVYNYVVFGSAEPFPADFNITELDGSNGFAIDTVDKPWYVQSAGDIISGSRSSTARTASPSTDRHDRPPVTPSPRPATPMATASTMC